jgi:hypothetical protein
MKNQADHTTTSHHITTKAKQQYNQKKKPLIESPIQPFPPSEKTAPPPSPLIPININQGKKKKKKKKKEISSYIKNNFLFSIIEPLNPSPDI